MAITGGKLSIQDLCAYYGKSMALDHIRLEIPGQQVTAVMGPSGCGKSTLVRCLNRIHETTPKATVEGQVLLDGEDIYELDPTLVRRRIGMVFQKPNPFATMSIYNNVAAALRFGGPRVSRSEMDQVVLQSLKQAALWEEVRDRLDSPATSLSGGQQQRLCIARALAAQPEVLLMDEPCSALDPVATAKIEELIADLKKNYTVVIVTHNMQQAARVSDFSTFLYLGKLIEFGPTEELFERPKEQLTESYITGRFG
jgi:phosphate transport system ATP-binding protein